MITFGRIFFLFSLQQILKLCQKFYCNPVRVKFSFQKKGLIIPADLMTHILILQNQSATLWVITQTLLLLPDSYKLNECNYYA